MKVKFLTVPGLILVLAVIADAAPQKGTMTDSRDRQVYRTVKIGNQVWMAANLNVKTDGSWCFKNKESNCRKYGSLYTWDAARKACPAGWHLPNNDEFETLFSEVGGKNVAGTVLKSKTGWKERGNGSDDSSFTALPAGVRYNDGKFGEDGYNAYFWSSTEAEGDDAYGMYLDYNNYSTYLYNNSRSLGFSVRCVKD